MSAKPLVALIGCPNAGKTALFNRLTGSRQKVANYPGVTVERKEGLAHLPNGESVRVLDLPGLYTLRAKSPDELISREVVLGHLRDIGRPDVLVCVADATNLKLHLRLVLELKQLGLPLILAINMMDIATRRGFSLDLDALSRELGIPVVGTVAVRQGKLDDLFAAITQTIHTPHPAKPDHAWHEPTTTELRELSRSVLHILDRADVAYGTPPVTTYRLDRLLLHPVFGLLILSTLMFCVFQAVFAWSAYPMDQLDAALSALADTITAHTHEGHLRSFLVDGVIAGVGSVVIFLPQILILYFFILLLEDSGYMARAAFLLDKLMGGVGLHGKAFIPLLSSFACAIPGIMAARTIESRTDRFITILIAPLMTCSARLPVYVLLIAAFIPDRTVWGVANLQGLVMFSLYAIALIFGLLIAFLLRHFLFRDAADSFVLELPSYKMPSLRNLIYGLLERAKIFLRRAGTTIFAVMIVLWFCSTFPEAPAGAENPFEYSATYAIGQAIAPVFAPIGFTWEMAVALIPGMAAREVAVGALASVYALSGTADPEASLAQTLKASWPLASALAFLVWYIFAPQCISTIAVMKRETASWKWTGFAVFYLFALAYAMAGATYHAAVAWL
jgi:ferrous iron transport protein B